MRAGWCVALSAWLLSGTAGCAWLRQGLLPVGSAQAVPQDPWRDLPSGVAGRKLQALWPFFVGQRAEAGCSLAASTLVLNAMRAQQGLPALSQAAVLASDVSGLWARAVAPGGAGVDVDTLRFLLLRAAASLRGAGPAAVIDVVHPPKASASAALRDEARRTLAYVLSRCEAHGDDFFVIVHAVVPGLWPAGSSQAHMSVVAAYDEDNERALLLDADVRQPFWPFWLSLDALLEAMQALDPLTGEPRGYLVLRSGR